MERQAERFPKRKYAAVDYLLGPASFFSSNRARLQGKGVRVGETVQEFLQGMIARKERARHLNMDMPYPFDTSAYSSTSREAFVHALNVLPHVLLPNGKLFVTSESLLTIHMIQELAAKKGFSVRRLRVIPPLYPPGYTPKHARELREKHPDYYHPGMTWTFADAPIYRLEITYNLKKAIPSKDARRKLAQVLTPREKKIS